MLFKIAWDVVERKVNLAFLVITQHLLPLQSHPIGEIVLLVNCSLRNLILFVIV